MDKFWMVIRAEGTGSESTQVRHTCEHLAIGKAGRLAREHGATFVVLEAVGYAEVEAIPVRYTLFEDKSPMPYIKYEGR